jgi:hypothetical protein
VADVAGCALRPAINSPIGNDAATDAGPCLDKKKGWSAPSQNRLNSDKVIRLTSISTRTAVSKWALIQPRMSKSSQPSMTEGPKTLAAPRSYAPVNRAHEGGDTLGRN